MRAVVFDADMIDKFIEMKQQGYNMITVAEALGVHHETMRQWAIRTGRHEGFRRGRYRVKWTEDMIQNVVYGLSRRHSQEEIAEKIGVAQSTLCRWLKEHPEVKYG